MMAEANRGRAASGRWGYLAIIAVLAIALVVLLLKFVVLGSTAPAPDGRTAVQLSSGERAFVLKEMRGFVGGLERIDVALGAGDRKAAAQASRALGTAAAHDAPVAILAKLPLQFKRMAFATHGGFDSLADDIERGAPLDELLRRRGQIMGQCVACHAEYAFEAGRAR